MNKAYVYKQLADLYRDGYWKRYSYGTLNLQHIRKNDIIEALDNMEDKKIIKMKHLINFKTYITIG